jgi:hypothetical protein
LPFLVGKKKLIFGVIGFFAPYITAGLTGDITWHEAARLSEIAAIAYIAGEGIADAGRGASTTIVAGDKPVPPKRRRGTIRQDV